MKLTDKDREEFQKEYWQKIRENGIEAIYVSQEFYDEHIKPLKERDKSKGQVELLNGIPIVLSKRIDTYLIVPKMDLGFKRL